MSQNQEIGYKHYIAVLLTIGFLYYFFTENEYEKEPLKMTNNETLFLGDIYNESFKIRSADSLDQTQELKALVAGEALFQDIDTNYNKKIEIKLDYVNPKKELLYVNHKTIVTFGKIEDTADSFLPVGVKFEGFARNNEVQFFQHHRFTVDSIVGEKTYINLRLYLSIGNQDAISERTDNGYRSRGTLTTEKVVVQFVCTPNNVIISNWNKSGFEDGNKSKFTMIQDESLTDRILEKIFREDINLGIRLSVKE